jgi:hypothetical protein
MGSEELSPGENHILMHDAHGLRLFFIYRYTTPPCHYLARAPSQDFHTDNYQEAKAWLEAMMLVNP